MTFLLWAAMLANACLRVRLCWEKILDSTVAVRVF